MELSSPQHRRDIPVYVREHLLASPNEKQTAFKPRPVEQLAKLHPPKSVLTIECQHAVRSGEHPDQMLKIVAESVQAGAIQPGLQQCTTCGGGSANVHYQLWLLAGRNRYPSLERPDDQFNSAIWRNIAARYGLMVEGNQSPRAMSTQSLPAPNVPLALTLEATNPSNPKVSENTSSITNYVATNYPLNISKPSALGEYTYSKFLRDTKLYEDPKRRSQMVLKTKAEEKEMRRLRAMTEARSPPLDALGNIVPPASFKHLPRWREPIPDGESSTSRSSQPLDQSSEQQGFEGMLPAVPPGLTTDMFGQQVQKRSSRRVWKLSLKGNSPAYDRVLTEKSLSRTKSSFKPPALVNVSNGLYSLPPKKYSPPNTVPARAPFSRKSLAQNTGSSIPSVQNPPPSGEQSFDP